MSGDRDPLYVQARDALLDAVETLREHLDAIVLVGAQAVYMHTGGTEFEVAEYTTDADLSVGPDDLSEEPLLAELLEANGFSGGRHPGSWQSRSGIVVDLMVPETLAGPGRRGADLGSHGRRVARRAKGLEGSLVDREVMAISSFSDATRSIEMQVAGPAALLVAKVHKISERTSSTDRLRDKDALDVFRLLRSISTNELARRMTHLLNDPLSAATTQEAVDELVPLFGAPDSAGVEMMLRALRDPDDSEVLATSMIVLATDLSAQV